MRNLLKPKYHLIFAGLAQIIIIAVNLGILVSFNYKLEFNTIYYIVIPNFFYTAFISIFYHVYWKIKSRDDHGKSKFNMILFNTIIIANIIYFIVTILDFENGLYYIDTVIIQVINAFFASKYILFDAESFTTGKEFVILKIFVYSAVVTTILSLYYCFDNIFVAWVFIIISAILLFITYSIYHTHFMRNLSRRRSQNREYDR